MTDLVTPAVERALLAARAFAASEGAVVAEPRHLALGLLAEPDGQAMAAARAHGLTPGRWTPAHPKDPTAVEEFSSASQAVLNKARQRARAYFIDKTVTTELLLTTAVESDAQLARDLAADGLDAARLVESLIGPLESPVPVEDLCVATECTAAGDGRSPSDYAVVDRIIDAAANRAREALRTLEDYARFGLNDPAVTSELKAVRHALAAALAEFPAIDLIAARDTPGDIGTGLSTDAEYKRAGPGSVVAANAKRLQESLRSLEEFGKTKSVRAGQAFERLRYRAYSVERDLLLRSSADDRLTAVQLYLLTPPSLPIPALERLLSESLAGGVQMVQLREKSVTDAEFAARARLCRRITAAAGVPLIINDRPDIALVASADGVHLGQDDLSVADARRVLGATALIGVSTHTLEQVHEATSQGANYIGVGPTFPSSTKPFEQFPGLPFVREGIRVSQLPVFALGGIAAANIADVLAAGASRVAVSSAITAAEQPRDAAASLRALLSPIR